MKKNILLTAFTSLLFSTAAFANDLSGVWQQIDDKTGSAKAIIEIRKEANQTYTGKIIKRYYSNVGINAWREIVELRSIILHELFYFINYTICFNSNVVKISKDLFDAVCRNGIRSGCNKRDFANAIVTLEKLNIIRRTDKRSMFEVNPRVIFKGDINKFHEIITKGKLDDSKIKLDNNVNYIDRIGLVKDDNCIIIKNKQVYKSELDYLYDDNENNVDKANNENNETEIIEAEEVDTGKIDWDW